MLMRRVLEQFEEGLKIRKHPYTYARVMAMRSKLISPGEYQRLMKLSLPGLLKFLQESEYKQEINRMALHYRGVELLERALNENLADTYAKLRRISSKDLSAIMDIFLLRRDIQNIKTILRGVHAGLEKAEIWDTVYPACFAKAEYDRVVSAGSVEEVLKRLDFIPFAVFRDELAQYSRTGSLSLIEATLDRHLLNEMLGVAGALPKGAGFLRDFLNLEVDLLNLKAILRLKVAGFAPKQVREIVLFRGGHLSKSDLRKMVEADLGNLTSLYMGGKYGKLFEGLNKDKPDITGIEIRLDRFLLKRSTLFQRKHPLTVDVILGYLFAKWVEVRNLEMMGKASHLRLGEEFVKNNLVI